MHIPGRFHLNFNYSDDVGIIVVGGSLSGGEGPRRPPTDARAPNARYVSMGNLGRHGAADCLVSRRTATQSRYRDGGGPRPTTRAAGGGGSRAGDWSVRLGEAIDGRRIVGDDDGGGWRSIDKAPGRRQGVIISRSRDWRQLIQATSRDWIHQAVRREASEFEVSTGPTGGEFRFLLNKQDPSTLHFPSMNPTGIRDIFT